MKEYAAGIKYVGGLSLIAGNGNFFLFEGLRLFYDFAPRNSQLLLVPARRHFYSKLKA